MGDEDEGSFNIFVDSDGAAQAAQNAIAAATLFPNHPVLPAKNVFEHKLIQKKISADKIVSIMENWLMTPASVGRASDFQPKKKDVIVVSGPQSGGELVSRIVRLIQSDYLSDTLKDTAGLAPLLESHYGDDDPLEIVRPQSSNGRVFRTTMTWNTHQPRMHPAGKYIFVLRHPLDLRASWIKWLEACFSVPASNPHFPKFSDMVSYDDFVNVPVTLCNASGKSISYEMFVSEWIREAKTNSDNVLLVFYESAFSSPAAEVKRIAKFLGISLSDETFEQIVSAVKVEGSQPVAASVISRRHSCGLGSTKFTKAAAETIAATWARVVTDVEPNAQTYEKFYEMQNHHHLYPYPQAGAETKREASSGGGSFKKKAAAAAAANEASKHASKGFFSGLTDSIAKYRAAQAAKKKEREEQLAKWKEQQKNIRTGATAGNVVIKGQDDGKELPDEEE